MVFGPGIAFICCVMVGSRLLGAYNSPSTNREKVTWWILTVIFVVGLIASLIVSRMIWDNGLV